MSFLEVVRIFRIFSISDGSQFQVQFIAVPGDLGIDGICAYC